MDRSYLSDPAVIAASRQLVCVRLLSYESKEEADFLKTFGAGRSGEVENTTFCIFAPDGKRRLTRAGRGPRMLYDGPQDLAASLQRISASYPARKEAKAPALPLVANVRLALDVAACDAQALVVLGARNEAARQRLVNVVAELAWSQEFVGRFVYAVAAAPKELEAIEGAAAREGLFVVAPDEFGLKGKVLQHVELTGAKERLTAGLQQGIADFQRPDRSFWAHVKTGHQQGIFWETQIPVTDPMEARAREKGRKQSPPRK
jgi:hypothetical protein